MKDDSFDCTLIAHLRIFLLFYRLLYCLILPENRLFFGIWKVVEIEVWERLPDDLSMERRMVVTYALALVDKVDYFWGGKSLVLGWDDRWGEPAEVTAEGSDTTGTEQPYGLDCSGFVDWAFYNASGGSYIIGQVGGAAAQHASCPDIAWDEMQPGDLLFYPEDEHVGIAAGRDWLGLLLVVHCASGTNGVTISHQTSFETAARPVWYADK